MGLVVLLERGQEREQGRGAWARWAPAAATGAFLLLLLPWWVRDATAGGWRYLEELLAAQYSAPAAGTVTSSDHQSSGGECGIPGGEAGGVRRLEMVAGVVGAAVVLTGYWTCLRRVGGGSELRGGWGLGGGGVGGGGPGGGRPVLAHQDRALSAPRDPLLGIYAIAGPSPSAKLSPA